MPNKERAMSIDANDPKLTAYALGELSDAERAAVEKLLTRSESARQAVERIRETAGELTHELAAEPTVALSETNRHAIEEAIQGNHQPSTAPASPTTRRLLRWVPIGIAASILLLLGILIVPAVTAVRMHKRIGFTTLTDPTVLDPGANAPQAMDPLPEMVFSFNARDNAGATTAPTTIAHGFNFNDLAGSSVAAAPDSYLLESIPGVQFNIGQTNRLRFTGQPYIAYGYQLPYGKGKVPIDALDKNAYAVNSAKQFYNSRWRPYNSSNHRGDGKDVFFDTPEGLVGPKQEGVRLGARFSSESYARIVDNPFLPVAQNPLSTFSIDVDTASYANVRRFLTGGQMPPPDAVRIEEMLNYFEYDYPQPTGDDPFSVNVEIAACPWQPDHRLMRVGLKGLEFAEEERPACNLVFLVDVSGSMQPANKLPLLKQAMSMLISEVGAADRVAIVVYAGSSGLVLPSTTADNQETLLHALGNLEAGGSTNGGAGIQLAYDVATENFIEGGANRVILATDGDFNVGITDQGDLTRLIENKAKSGVFLSVLGFGMGNLKDSTLETLADKGNGNYAYIDTLNEARKVLVDQVGGTLVTIAKDVKIQIEFNPAEVAAYRLIGYENRILAAQDFNDDTKDAGEIGAGHTVTALYEIVPAGVEIEPPDPAAAEQPGVDPLKYQVETQLSEAAYFGELATVKLRYKQPDGDVSKLIETSVADSEASFAQSTEGFRFAASVASFGMMLRHSPYIEGWTFDAVLELAAESVGEDHQGYRAEFVELVKQALSIDPR
jgi:Ca-activated chloride channel family protein